MTATQPAVPAAPAPRPSGAAGAARRIWRVIGVPVGAIILAVIVGSIVILLSSLLVGGGIDWSLPFKAYKGLACGSLLGPLPICGEPTWNGVINTAVASSPLILGGLAVGLGFKAGLFNIGAQGQFLMGALGAAWIGASVATLPGPIAIVIALVAGAFIGFAWGFVPGFLKAFTGAHEVVTTIMLNYISLFVIAYIVTGPLRVAGASFARTADVGAAALPILVGRNGHIGVLIAVALVPVIYWLLWRTKLGFEIRAVGANPEAARYAGMGPRRLTVLTMGLSGGLAGLAGGIEILGITHYLPIGYGTTVGFDAIAVALLGRSHPVGILAAAILFGAMRAGGQLMQIQAGIPVEIVDVLQGVILFFLAADIIVRRILRIRRDGGVGDEAATITRSYGEQTAV
jgi:simple sugar transport system permease protein